jgi:bifunctional UDP-N-acetylglucosamine pyrophosphorylase/glucosamine-1-phosphate N-acetyltransferase
LRTFFPSFIKHSTVKKLAAIILAAGKGTRMKSSLPKVLHEIADRPMVFYPAEVALNMKCQSLVMVIGHGGEQIRDRLKSVKKIQYVLQKDQSGSAHAVLMTEPAFKNFEGDVLILSGDVPLLQSEMIRQLLECHQTEQNALTIATLKLSDPTGYGRVVRDSEGRVLKIVEETDTTEEERKINEVNGGLYVAKLPLLFEALKKVKKNPIKKEYYFTDLPVILQEMGHRVGGFLVEDSTELLGVNTRWDLAVAERMMQQRIQKKWMLSGVTIISPERTTIHSEVEIGEEGVIYPGAELLGKTKIGRGCVIEQGVILKDMVLEDRVTVKAYSYLEGSMVESEAVIGPFARIRPESRVSKKARIGNFVELKKTVLGEGSKANHLSYLGDAVIGKDVNVGAGTITCNYDGDKKYQTHIEDRVFIGSDTQLVAPVRVGKESYVGAGTTITKNVPAGSLALSREEQKNILGYSKKKKKK